MPSFAYEAVDRHGSRRNGTFDAASVRAASTALEASGFFVVQIRNAPSTEKHGRAGSDRRAVLELTRAISALLSAGMPLARALSAASLALPERIRERLDLVRREVERGTPLSSALSGHPRLFPPLYTGVLRAAEKSGDLAGGFEELAGTLERQQELREKLISLSIYPVLLATVGTAAVIVLVAVVMPRFVVLLEGTGTTLPTSTRVLLAFAETVRRYGVFIAAAFAVAVILAGSAFRTAQGRLFAARMLLSLPLIGSLRRQTLAGRFARLTAVLVANGAAVLSALSDAAASMADPVAELEVDRIRSEVRQGSTLHAAVGSGRLFPPLLPQIVAVGEESGRLPTFLYRAAEIFERGTQRALERLVALLEPAMIVLFGGIVAFVALALLQAIYGMNAGGVR